VTAEQLQGLLEDGVKEGVYTAAVALVGSGGELYWQGAAGRVASSPDANPITNESVFDLASLTKSLATALAVMVLQQQGRVSGNAPLGEYLPPEWLPADKARLTLQSLLAHRAGLPAWRPFYEDVLRAPLKARPNLLERLAAATPLEYPPETATLYSDLGFMLLKAVVEAVAGDDLDTFCRRKIYRPLGLVNLGFRPLTDPTRSAVPCAATETGLIPYRRIWGEVHDENAWAAGGVAGHAGLFGTGEEVFQLMAALHRAYGGETIWPFTPGAVRLWLTPVAPGARTLGFDVPDPNPEKRSCGVFFSHRSVGHLGFTGTSVWLDLNDGKLVVLLTNRVHLGRHCQDKIRGFRPRFHEVAAQALRA
jgi:CubicO group peptidase (beta-lactamase class C family)